LTLNAPDVCAFSASIMESAPDASTAPTAIEPRAPASVTDAARAGVPAIGAWIIGSSIPIRFSKLAIDTPFFLKSRSQAKTFTVRTQALCPF